jgi:hypothetical protein
MMTIAPKNTGRPAIELPTSFAGSSWSSGRSLPGAPVAPSRPAYGTR